MKEHLYGVVIRKGAKTARLTTTAPDLERAFGKAAVMMHGDRWPGDAEECTLWVRKIHSPHEEKKDG